MYTELQPVTHYFYPLLQDKYSESDFAQEFEKTLASPIKEGVENLLYVHIPYCHDLCKFCPFHVKVAREEQVYSRYVDSLIAEMELVNQNRYIAEKKYTAVYFGGGSPSILSADLLDKLFKALHSHFKFTQDVEISFEGEPVTLSDMPRLKLLKEYGVSRISYGVQTFDQKIRDLFNINATLGDVHRCFENATKLGFSDVNIDMMYDLPGQDISHVNKDIQKVIEYGYHSVDYYNLHYSAFPSKFNAALKNGEIPPKPSDQMHFSLYEQVKNGLLNGGYGHVADQIFTQHNELCEYFRLLWGGGAGKYNAEVVALGSSARGYLNGISYMNHSNVNRYSESLNNDILPIEKLSRKLNTPANRGAVFLMKFFKLSKSYLDSFNTIDADIWEKWRMHGYVYETDSHWCISEEGKRWLTNMMNDVFEVNQQIKSSQAVKMIYDKPGTRTGSF